MVKSKAKPKKASKVKAGGGLVNAAVSAGTSLLGGGKSKGSGKRRNHGPTYWANKVLVARLKKKYNSIKYGGLR